MDNNVPTPNHPHHQQESVAVAATSDQADQLPLVLPSGPASAQGGDPQQQIGVAETKPPLPAEMASTYDTVEPMSFVYVLVVKARDLPTMEAAGTVDPYGEVKLGDTKGRTKHLEKNPNPEWRQTFAFSRENLQSNQLEVIVKDRDLFKDEFIGRVVFDMASGDIPHRVPPESPLAPRWYRLEHRSGGELSRGEILLAVWTGVQADEQFPEAWHSDAHTVSTDGLANRRSRDYNLPSRPTKLKVVAIAAKDLVPAGNKGRPLAPTIAKIEFGGQMRCTRPVHGFANPAWNEEFIFDKDQFDGPLLVTVDEQVAPGRNEPLGYVVVPAADLTSRSLGAKWFNLSRAPHTGSTTLASKIHLQLTLETA